MKNHIYSLIGLRLVQNRTKQFQIWQDKSCDAINDIIHNVIKHCINSLFRKKNAYFVGSHRGNYLLNTLFITSAVYQYMNYFMQSVHALAIIEGKLLRQVSKCLYLVEFPNFLVCTWEFNQKHFGSKPSPRGTELLLPQMDTISISQ